MKEKLLVRISRLEPYDLPGRFIELIVTGDNSAVNYSPFKIYDDETPELRRAYKRKIRDLIKAIRPHVSLYIIKVDLPKYKKEIIKKPKIRDKNFKKVFKDIQLQVNKELPGHRVVIERTVR